MRTWPRLTEILPALTEGQRGALAEAFGLAGAVPGWQALSERLLEDRLIRRVIRSLPDRALRSLRRILAAQGEIPSAGLPGLTSLVKAGLVLPAPDGPALPLEFAFASPECLPAESLLGLIARASLAELAHWLEQLRTLLGIPGRENPSSLLPAAAEIFRLLTDQAGRLVAGLDEAARLALEELGPADGLIKRRPFLAKHAPDLPDCPCLPYRIPSACPESLRQLLLRGLLVPSGPAGQSGVYLYIPTELRPAALDRYCLMMEERAGAVLAEARRSPYRPGGTRLGQDGPALLRHTAGVLAACPLRLTQKGQIMQADLERLGQMLGVRSYQAEALVLLACGLGLAAPKEGRLTAVQRQEWPGKALPARRALAGLSLSRPGRILQAQETQDFLSFLRLTALAGLAQAGDWLALTHLRDLLATRPGIGRWLEYFWSREGWHDSLGAALGGALETLWILGAVEIEADPDTPGDCRAARILPWGLSLLAEEADLSWPPAESPIVTANHEVYAPLGLGPAALARLGRLADLTAAGPAMVFRLSRDSLLRAAGSGMKIAEELAWLTGQARGGIPQNVAENIADIAGRQGEVRLAPAGGYLQVRNPSLLMSLKQAPALAPLILAEADGLLVLAPGADLARLARELARMGLLLEPPAGGTGKRSR